MHNLINPILLVFFILSQSLFGIDTEPQDQLTDGQYSADSVITRGLVKEAEVQLYKDPSVSLVLLDSALVIDKSDTINSFRAKLRSLQGVAFAMMGDSETSKKLFHKARRYYEKVDDEENLTKISTNLANIHRLNGRTDSTCYYLLESLHHTVMLNDTAMLISNYANIAGFFLEYDDFERAQRYIDASLEIEASSGRQEEFAVAYQIKGFLEQQEGRFDAAEKSFLASDERAIVNGDDRLRANLIRDIAGVRSFTGREEEARVGFNQALKRVKEIGILHHVAGVFNEYAQFEQRMDNYERADSLFSKALVLYDSLGAEMDLSDVLLGMAKNEFDQDKVDTALAYASKSLALAENAEAPHRQIACLELLTSIARKKEDESALQKYDLKLAKQLELVQEDWDLLEGVVGSLDNAQATPIELEKDNLKHSNQGNNSTLYIYLLASLIILAFLFLVLKARKNTRESV